MEVPKVLLAAARPSGPVPILVIHDAVNARTVDGLLQVTIFWLPGSASEIMPHSQIVSQLVSDNLASVSIIVNILIDAGPELWISTTGFHPGDANSSRLVFLGAHKDIGSCVRICSWGIFVKVLTDPTNESFFTNDVNLDNWKVGQYLINVETLACMASKFSMIG